MQNCQKYIQDLEEELRKIQVFSRELPLCLDLVTQTIETCRQQLSSNGQSECNSEQTSSDFPVFEEFIPIKRASSHESGEEEQESSKRVKNDDDAKSDWLRSVHLWNQSSDPISEMGLRGEDDAVEGVNGDEKEENGNQSVAAVNETSSAEKGEEIKKEGECLKKPRRCWSPELHRRFLQALQELGGSDVATPKQIKELMKVEGLTNDEVKSHLQKYRLHSKKINLSNQNTTGAQPPQFVVVGGIWVSPEYTAVTTTPTEAIGQAPSKEIYRPIATLPLPQPSGEASISHQQRRRRKPSHESDNGMSVRSRMGTSSMHKGTNSQSC